MQSNEWIEFYPRPSRGRWWTGGLGLSVILMFVVPFIPGWNDIHFSLIAIFATLGLAISMLMLVPAWYFPEIRYWVGPDELVLRFGPLMKDRIPLDSIRSIHPNKNLRISPLSSFRFPGLALFDVHYRDEGKVRMCSTSASKGILIIDTGKRKYGITPEDEPGLLAALRARIEERDVVEVNTAEYEQAKLETVEH